MLELFPPELLTLIGGQFVGLDKLHCVNGAARDIASIACVSRGYKELARSTLWPLLGQQLALAPAGARPKGCASVAEGDQDEHRWVQSKVRKIDRLETLQQMKKLYEEEADPAVPEHVFHECHRLSNLGLAGTNVKAEFRLTDSNLRPLTFVPKSRGAYGTAHLYRIPDVVRVASEKHCGAGGLAGSVAALEAAQAAKHQAAVKRKREQEEATAVRRTELLEALAPHGVEVIHTPFYKTTPVASFLTSKKGATLEAAVQDAVLHDFLRKKTSYMSLRIEAHQPIYFMEKHNAPDGCYGKRDRDPYVEEDRELQDIALQSWAKWQPGGAAGAVQAVPALLQERMRQALANDLRHAIFHGWGMMSSDDEEWHMDAEAEGAERG